MSWDIKVRHDDLGDRARLIIEAGPEIPDEVIASIAGAYWLEEVQYVPDEWDDPGLEPVPGDSGSHMHG